MMNAAFQARITVFYCINSFSESAAAGRSVADGLALDYVKMACSSMVKDVYLLRAFEAGADAVVVLVCPQGQCRYVEGNLRAQKRVAWVQGILDQIGLDGKRLSIHNVGAHDTDQVVRVIEDTVARLAHLGPSPAR
jgi:coenzyme F420-reducing hydrogenase delta subunit